MNPKFLLYLALVVSGVLVGCKSSPDSRLDGQRQRLATIYQDKIQPMTDRVAAFDSLLETFKPGTPRAVLDKYFPWPVADLTSRNTENESWFELHVNAPDGSDRWIQLKGEEYENQAIACPINP